jgi:fructose-1,6-bisphosphatase I
MPHLTNLTCHLLQQETDDDSHALIDVINQLTLASKIISREINKAGLTNFLGSAGKINVQDEEQMKLDEYANDVFTEILRQSPYVAAVGTEECEEMIFFDDEFHHSRGRYVVYMDPVDGSSNIDVNVSIGTNFAIFKKELGKWPVTEADYLQPGKNAVAAGYIVYGASTMLVYSTGQGVNGLTLDPSIGEYILSHPNMKIPQKNAVYSTNESYSPHWSPELQNYITELKTSEHPPTARYIGSLVADFHRNLLKGGIYLYPADAKKPAGKLRLMYEGIPFAYLAEQAGGYASDGKQSILEIVPTSVHQRTPLFVGNKEEVKKLETIQSGTT